MTQWGGVELQQWCRRAGWRGDEVRRAAAVSWALSSWQDHYSYTPRDLPSWVELGLFGIHPGQVELVSISQLFDPLVSCQLAHQLWHESSSSWQWLKQYQVGGEQLIEHALMQLDARQLWGLTAAEMPRAGQARGGWSQRIDPGEIMRGARSIGPIS